MGGDQALSVSDCKDCRQHSVGRDDSGEITKTVRDRNLFGEIGGEPRMKGCAAGLRYELCLRNASYAAESRLPHALSSGQQAVVVYQSSDDRRHHGNFLDASYRAILQRPEWRRRLQKVHSHGNRSLPKSEWVWREFDSSMSSDALLMNIFCYPGVTKRREVSLLLGTEPEEFPQFGFMPRVPWSRVQWRGPRWT